MKTKVDELKYSDGYPDNGVLMAKINELIKAVSELSQPEKKEEVDNKVSFRIGSSFKCEFCGEKCSPIYNCDWGQMCKEHCFNNPFEKEEEYETVIYCLRCRMEIEDFKKNGYKECSLFEGRKKYGTHDWTEGKRLIEKEEPEQFTEKHFKFVIKELRQMNNLSKVQGLSGEEATKRLINLFNDYRKHKII